MKSVACDMMREIVLKVKNRQTEGFRTSQKVMDHSSLLSKRVVATSQGQERFLGTVIG